MRRILLIIQLPLFGLCLWWLSVNVDWESAVKQCIEVNPLILFVVFAQRYFPYIMLGIRLTAIFPGQVGFCNGLKASVLCVGCNNILPARFGEAIKILWLRRHVNLAISQLCGGVFLERLQDVTVLLLMALIFAMFLLQPWFTVSMVLILSVLWAGVIFFSRRQSLAARGLQVLRLPDSWRRWCLSFLSLLGFAMRRNIFFRTAGTTLLVWGMNYAHVALLANGLMQLHLDWSHLGLLCVAIFFSSGLLLTPGGLGGMEVAVVMVLTMMGVDSTRATGTAIFVRLFYSVPPLLGVMAILLSSRHEFFTCIHQLLARRGSFSSRVARGHVDSETAAHKKQL